MTIRHPQLLEKIRSIVERLDDIPVDAVKAWEALAAELKPLLADRTKVTVEASSLLERVAERLERLGTGAPAERLAAVEAIAAALMTVEAAMLGQAPDGWSNEATAGLDAVFHPAAAADGCQRGSRIETIDDAAAFLVGLEAEDRDGWRALAGAVERLPQPSGCHPLFAEAVRLCHEMADAAAEPMGCIGRIGDLLDDIVNHREQPAPQVGTGEPSPPLQEETVPQPMTPVDFMPASADPDLMAEFITESTDLIQTAEEALLSLEHDPDDTEAVSKVFRAFHTVKGTAGFLDLSLIAELGHHAETLLSRVRDGEVRYSGGYADLSLQALDTIKHLVAAVRKALEGEPLRKPDGYDVLLQTLRNPEGAGISEESSDAGAPRIGDILVAQGKLGREQVEKALTDHPEEKVGMALVKSQAVSVSDVSQALRAQKQIRSGTAPVMDASVRVSTQRLDRLIDMVGELVIAYSMVAQDGSVVNSQNHGLAKKVAHASKIVRELQDISMSMRMVPLKATFSKMARLARDVARKLGKNVNFLTEGEDTEIDRNLVDIINDPLVHMVRNAVDHGVETPDVRRAAGKSEQGTVRIAAYHSAGSVVVEINDDGKGLDRDVLLAKARERGLISDTGDFSDREVFNLIFEPGFSTAQVVTDVSGRGVGMDVVRKNIEQLHGTVEIKSEKGAGSVFRMSLPLTLAIIDGMVIRVGRETYVIPTISIIRSVKPAAEDIATVFQQGEMLRLQGQLIPLYRMSRIYGIEDAQEDLQKAIVVVVEDEDRHAGLVIDELVSRQQVVIKSLGETLKNTPGISGGAIMPDGRVGLILDVGGLLRFATPDRRDVHREETGNRPPALAA
ncbi:MAG: chemotaxis protein CheA [Desulfobacterales bacterium]|jgi:two-component system chemotaxis sensor kinase CheA|nr:chemotaxis protein CheA [Desulfobacterales bacterium]